MPQVFEEKQQRCLRFCKMIQSKPQSEVLAIQLCLTICNPMDCSPPASLVHGILQAVILEWLPCPSLTQWSNPGLSHCRWILYHLSHQDQKKSSGRHLRLKLMQRLSCGFPGESQRCFPRQPEFSVLIPLKTCPIPEPLAFPPFPHMPSHSTSRSSSSCFPSAYPHSTTR